MITCKNTKVIDSLCTIVMTIQDVRELPRAHRTEVATQDRLVTQDRVI